MKAIIISYLAALTLLDPAVAQQSGGKRTVDVAREIFQRAAAAHLKVSPKNLVISPSADPDPQHAELQTGELHAWTAWKKDGPRLLTGFSSAGPDAAIAFDGYRGGIGQPGGIAALLKACHIHEPKRRLPVNEIAARVAFCLGDPGMAELLFDKKLYESSGFVPPASVTPPKLRPQKTGQILTYVTMTHGNTGTWDLRKISVTILPDYKTIIHREDLR